METRNRKRVKIMALLLLILSVIFFIRWNSELNRNNRQLTKQLLETDSETSGEVEELFTFAYDELYVFTPYQPKESMEEELGFETRILQETVNENMMNLLFVKDDQAVAYLYGYGANNGFYLDIPAGHYSKNELEEMSYQVERNDLGNSSAKERSYLHYTFDF